MLIGSVVAMTVGGAAYLAYKGLSEATVFGMFTLATVAINAIVGTLKQDAGAAQVDQQAGDIKAKLATAEKKIDANTIITVKGKEEVVGAVAKAEKAANGMSDKRAAEAKEAGIAQGKAERTAEMIAAVAEVAPDLAPVVAAKLP